MKKRSSNKPRKVEQKQVSSLDQDDSNKEMNTDELYFSSSSLSESSLEFSFSDSDMEENDEDEDTGISSDNDETENKNRRDSSLKAVQSNTDSSTIERSSDGNLRYQRRDSTISNRSNILKGGPDNFTKQLAFARERKKQNLELYRRIPIFAKIMNFIFGIMLFKYLLSFLKNVYDMLQKHCIENDDRWYVVDFSNDRLWSRFPLDSLSFERSISLLNTEYFSFSVLEIDVKVNVEFLTICLLSGTLCLFNLSIIPIPFLSYLTRTSETFFVDGYGASLFPFSLISKWCYQDAKQPPKLTASNSVEGDNTSKYVSRTSNISQEFAEQGRRSSTEVI